MVLRNQAFHVGLLGTSSWDWADRRRRREDSSVYATSAQPSVAARRATFSQGPRTHPCWTMSEGDLPEISDAAGAVEGAAAACADATKAEPSTPFNVADLAAEAEAAAVEQAKALAAARALAVRAAEAKAEAERAAREAAEAEEAAILEAEQAFPNVITAERIRADQEKKLPASMYWQQQLSEPRSSCNCDEGGSREDDVLEWRRRPDAAASQPTKPRTFVPAAEPSRPAWTMKQPQQQQWADQVEEDQAEQASPWEPRVVPQRGSATSPPQSPHHGPSSSRFQQQQPSAGSTGAFRSAAVHAWLRGKGGTPSGKPSLAQIQAEEQRASEAKRKLEELVAKGFAASKAAEALIRCDGDVSKAADALERAVRDPWGVRNARARDASAPVEYEWARSGGGGGDRRRQRERDREREEEVKTEKAWSPPKDGKVQVMMRVPKPDAPASVDGSVGTVVSSGSVGSVVGGGDGNSNGESADRQSPPSGGSTNGVTGTVPRPAGPMQVLTRQPPPGVRSVIKPGGAQANGHAAGGGQATMMQQTHLFPTHREVAPLEARSHPHLPRPQPGHPPPSHHTPRLSQQQHYPMQSQPRSQVVAAASSPHARTSPRPPPPAAGSSNGQTAVPATSLSLAEKIALIKAELVLPAGLPMAAALNAANEQMGIDPLGALPQQADRLLSIMGLPRAAMYR